jgi:hypothetical protein
MIMIPAKMSGIIDVLRLSGAAATPGEQSLESEDPGDILPADVVCEGWGGQRTRPWSAGRNDMISALKRATTSNSAAISTASRTVTRVGVLCNQFQRLSEAIVNQ